MANRAVNPEGDTNMRPIELIVTNALHGMADVTTKLPKALIDAATPGTVEEAVARDIRCKIAHEARLDLVMKAIAAAGGPKDAGEISARFKAVQEMHRPDANR